MVRRGLLFGCLAPVLSVGPLWALNADRLRVQRQEVFEFTEGPQVARRGDQVTITFTVKAFCDATVAIEDGTGRIIRHLASGVLGPNAPEPFQRNVNRQALTWDGKDDHGQYVDDLANVTVRVSLGLKAQFERTLFWSAKKKGAHNSIHLIRATPEGVYVSFPGEEVQIRLFDHDAKYVRTVYPFPAGQLDKVLDLPRRDRPPDGKSFPLKQGTFQISLLSDVIRELEPHGDRLYMVGTRLKRLGKDGSSGGGPFYGPETAAITISTLDAFREPSKKPLPIAPLSAAMSPDGKWLYLAGYGYGYIGGDQYGHSRMLQGVMRVDPNGEAKAEMFAGDMEKGGADDTHFDEPRAVVCDPKGRVLIADRQNDRIQVFTPDGKLLKSIPIWKPTVMRINPRTGELYVFAWRVGYNFSYGQMDKWDTQDPKRPASLTVLASVDDPTVRVAYPLDVPSPGYSETGGMAGAYADVDFWVPGGVPRLWIVNDNTWQPNPLRVFDLLDGKLVPVHDFEKEAAKEIVQVRPPGHSRWRLHVNPKNGKVYVAEDHFPAAIVVKGSSSLIELDPETGRQKIVQLPFDCEDLGFDLDGQAHLRGFEQVGRYDGETWREVPFDYGENRMISYQGLRQAEAVAALQFPDAGNASSQMGGFWVSPRGRVVITSHNPKRYDPKTDTKRVTKAVTGGSREVQGLRLMPGRADTCVIHVFDKYGRVLYEDAVPGVGYSEGVAMDKDDNLYLMAVTPGNLAGKPYPEPYACTLVKLRPLTKVLTAGAPVPLGEALQPKRPPDVLAWRDAGNSWIEGLEWTFPGVGMDTQNLAAGSGRCHCIGNSRFTLDLFARSFAPELARYDVAVIDAAGNAILRIGRFGNVDDGMPIVKAGGPPSPVSIGGDEVALMAPRFVAVHTDRRLFIGDRGNERILSVRLDYHATKRVALKDVPEAR